MLAQKYDKILDLCTPYLISHPNNLEYFSLELKVGSTTYPVNHISAFGERTMMNKILWLDALGFSDSALAMANWVAFDCAAMPGPFSVMG